MGVLVGALYGALRDRLPRYLHATTQVRDLGYRILKSNLGAWSVASAAFLLAIGLIGEFAPDILRFRPFGWSYSIADLYPFSFLGLALPPLIWAVVWPLRNQAYVRASQRMVWIVFAAALLISAAYLYANTGGREPWIWPRSAIRQQIGFIYPVLVVIVMQAGVLAHAWGRGLYGPGRHAIVRRPLVRALVTLAAITSMAWTGWHGARHGLAYHLAVLASSRRDTGAATVMAGDGSHGIEMLQEGLQLYDRSLHWVPRNVAAISGRSAILLQLGEYKRALEGFDRTVQLAPDNASYRLWRGVTYHAQQQLDLALLDYEWILARDPAHVNALTGRGWVYFQRAYRLSTILGQVSDEPARDSLRTLSRQYYHEALSSFEAALAIQPAVDLWLAVGYVHYGLEDYHAAEQAWRNAQVGEQRADVLLALATVHWRLATLGGFACDQASAPLGAKESGAAQIESAIAEIDHALELDPAADFTHRTRAQLEFLLRNCPGYDFGDQVAAAIAGYSDIGRSSTGNAPPSHSKRPTMMRRWPTHSSGRSLHPPRPEQRSRQVCMRWRSQTPNLHPRGTRPACGVRLQAAMPAQFGLRLTTCKNWSRTGPKLRSPPRRSTPCCRASSKIWPADGVRVGLNAPPHESKDPAAATGSQL
ncbi:MAG: tetratricopeptide repeat protein [Anaerolineales bacterium]